MMKPGAKQLIVFVMGVAFAAPALAAWKLVAEGETFTHEKSGYSIQYPEGWRWIKMPFGDETLATRDGAPIQAIAVDFRRHKKAFRALNMAELPITIELESGLRKTVPFHVVGTGEGPQS
jgi:hypothetical protein